MSWLLPSLPSALRWSKPEEAPSTTDSDDSTESSAQTDAPTLTLDAPSPPRSRSASPPTDLNIAIIPDAVPLGDMPLPPSTTTRPNFGIKPGGGMEPPPSPSLKAPSAPSLGLPTSKPEDTIFAPLKPGQRKVKGRGRVALAPGCSALDWARLSKSGADLRGIPPGPPLRITMDELKKHNTRDNAWSAFNGVVYNLTPYLRFHPGGADELMRVAGRDGTKLFMLTHSWVNMEHLMAECMVGMLVRG